MKEKAIFSCFKCWSGLIHARTVPLFIYVFMCVFMCLCEIVRKTAKNKDKLT